MEVPSPPAGFAWKLKWFAAVVGPLYAVYQITNRWQFHPARPLPLTWIDRNVPLLPWTVWPYLLLACCVSLLLLLKSRAVFTRALVALIAGYSINLLTFFLWPTMLPRDGLPGGVHEGGFAWLYSLDTPCNCFPSGHITAPLIAFYALAVEQRRWRTALWLIFALLCPTILTTKQHYFADLLGGLATGAFGIWISGLWMRRAAQRAHLSRLGTPFFNAGVVNLHKFRRDPLHFMTWVTEKHGPVVRCRLAWYVMTIVHDPAAALAVLKLPHRAVNKNTRSVSRLKRISGHSLLTASGDEWFRLRRMVQPVFHHHRVADYEKEIRRLTATMLDEWLRAGGRPIAIGTEMRRLTFRFICRVLLSADPSDEMEALEKSIGELLDEAWQEIRSPSDLRWRLPTRHRKRFDRALTHVRGFLQRHVSVRRGAAQQNGDLLTMLMAVKDADTGEGLPDDAIINESITLLIAGYDTTANALAWAQVLLSQHPEAAARLHSEALTGGTKYARAVFMETLRLYPPIWVIERNLSEDVAAGNWRLPEGAQVLISPWVLHRSPQHWDQPEEFRPERFLDPAAEHPAYFPFGAGPRSCIGRGLAIMEGETVLAMIAAAGSLQLSGPPPGPDPGITLRPAGGLSMSFTALTPV